MDIIDAVVLGLVQGLAEFIPVSSSGHLIVASELFGLDSSFEFDVLLNIGTVLALIWYFRVKIAGLFKGTLTTQKGLILALIVGTIPTALVGGLYTDFFDQSWVRSAQTAAVMLISVGLIMVWLDSRANGERDLAKVDISDGLGSGLAQVLALIPGTSRSGITIIAGRWRGLNYQTAAEFSFLLGVPILTGAVVRVLLDTEGRSFVSEHTAEFLLGNVMSFAAGLWAVSFMIGWLGRHSLKPFGWYRIGLGLLVLILTV
jgi:undecaprenyl-diphosphatase